MADFDDKSLELLLAQMRLVEAQQHAQLENLDGKIRTIFTVSTLLSAAFGLGIAGEVEHVSFSTDWWFAATLVLFFVAFACTLVFALVSNFLISIALTPHSQDMWPTYVTKKPKEINYVMTFTLARHFPMTESAIRWKEWWINAAHILLIIQGALLGALLAMTVFSSEATVNDSDSQNTPAANSEKAPATPAQSSPSASQNPYASTAETTNNTSYVKRSQDDPPVRPGDHRIEKRSK